MKSIICFSVVIIISSLFVFIGPVNSARGKNGGRNNGMAALCDNTNALASNTTFLTKATGCVTSMDSQIRSGLATCLTTLNKSPTNPTDVLSVLCDQNLFQQLQQCLRTGLRKSDNSINEKEAQTQVRTAIITFRKCIQH